MATTPLNLLQAYKPKFCSILENIPDKNDIRSASRLVKMYAEILVDKVGSMTPQKIVDNHRTDAAFNPDQGDPSPQTMKESWWNDDSNPHFLFRTLFPIGPASTLIPPYFQRMTQGILCERHFDNNHLSPIEFMLRHATKVFCHCNLDGAEAMEVFIEICTSTDPVVNNQDIDALGYAPDKEFVMVAGKQNYAYRANRLDLVYALRLLFSTGYMIFFANPIGFKWCHPFHLITNVFLAQTKFFPEDSYMDEIMSDAEKQNYLFALGVKVFHAMNKELMADFFQSRHLFPTMVSPTNMPAPLALGYVPQPDAPQPDDPFTTSSFLFGNQVPEDTTEDGITAKIFDFAILENYNAVLECKNLGQLSTTDVKTLVIIICPKTTLPSCQTKKKNYGLGNKAEMIRLLEENITTFGTTHEAYLKDLEAAFAANPNPA